MKSRSRSTSPTWPHPRHFAIPVVSLSARAAIEYSHPWPSAALRERSGPSARSDATACSHRRRVTPATLHSSVQDIFAHGRPWPTVKSSTRPKHLSSAYSSRRARPRKKDGRTRVQLFVIPVRIAVDGITAFALTGVSPRCACKLGLQCGMLALLSQGWLRWTWKSYRAGLSYFWHQNFTSIRLPSIWLQGGRFLFFFYILRNNKDKNFAGELQWTGLCIPVERFTNSGVAPSGRFGGQLRLFEAGASRKF